MAVGIKTIEILKHIFPTIFLVMRFQILVLSHFEYSALVLLQITSTLLLSLDKQMNWALKSVYFRSRIKDSFVFRIKESVLGIRQRIELKSLTYFSRKINKKKLFQTKKLLTTNLRLNNRSNQTVF